MQATPTQQKWDGLIKRHGMRAALRSNGVDRPITVSIQAENAVERLGAVSNPLDRVALVSALDPDTGRMINPPPTERDVLVAKTPEGTTLLFRIFAPPDRIGIDLVPLYWQLKVRT